MISLGDLDDYMTWQSCVTFTNSGSEEIYIESSKTNIFEQESDN